MYEACGAIETHFSAGGASKHFCVIVMPCELVHAPPSSRSIGRSHWIFTVTSLSLTIATPPGNGLSTWTREVAVVTELDEALAGALAVADVGDGGRDASGV